MQIHNLNRSRVKMSYYRKISVRHGHSDNHAGNEEQAPPVSSIYQRCVILRPAPMLRPPPCPSMTADRPAVTSGSTRPPITNHRSPETASRPSHHWSACKTRAVTGQSRRGGGYAAGAESRAEAHCLDRAPPGAKVSRPGATRDRRRDFDATPRQITCKRSARD